MCMIDLSEPSKVQRSTERTARKQHRCDECGRTIEKGERYEVAAGLYDDHWFSCKTCQHCKAARRWLNDQCGGWVYAYVYEDLREHWMEEPLLRSMWLGRVIVSMKRKWQNRDGSLMPVPTHG